MNAPPTLQPLRHLMKRGLRSGITRPTQHVTIQPCTQVRRQATLNPKQPIAATTSIIKSTTNSDPANPEDDGPRFHRSLQALYLQPLRRTAEYGVPTCDLQLRSFSVPSLEFFSDFALRAAYYLGLPAYGPTPLPRIVERWTVPRSSFIHKKSQENFERVTLRRLIQIRDGHPEAVQMWLAYLQKHAYYGVGMKANVWEFDKIEIGKSMDESLGKIETLLEDKWAHLAESPERNPGTPQEIEDALYNKKIKAMTGVRDQTRATFITAMSYAACRRALPWPARRRCLPGCLFQQTRAASGTATPLSSSPSTHQGAPIKSKGKVIFSGIQPTGVPHLGNYLGALRNWKRLQDEADPDTRLLFSIVDLHAITTSRTAKTLRQDKRQMLAALLAVGLDPARSTIFYQSTVPAHSELMWLLSCQASMGYLSRMTQWKACFSSFFRCACSLYLPATHTFSGGLILTYPCVTQSKMSLGPDASPLDDTETNRINSKGEKIKEGLKHGLFSYPLLQAADILVHRATHVPVGEDQSQHLEFSREIATTFSHQYPTSGLVEPQTLISDFKRVMSLMDPRKKMSKSDPSAKATILLSDSADVVRSKVMGAVTDSRGNVRPGFTFEERPGVSNLVDLLTYFDGQGRSRDEILQDNNDISLQNLKSQVADAIIGHMGVIRERYLNILDQNQYLDEVLARGTAEAQASAEKTMRKVRKAVGLGL